MNVCGRKAFKAGDSNPDWKPLLSGLAAKPSQADSKEDGLSMHVRTNFRISRPMSGQSLLLVQPAFSNHPFRSPVMAGATWIHAPRFRFASESFQGRSLRSTWCGPRERESRSLESL